MKILITSDLHYRLKQFDWLAEQAVNYDALIIAGDLLDISHPMDLSVQIVVMKKYLRKIGAVTRLLVCSGNHDGNEKNDADEYVAPWLQEVRAERVHVDGDNVFFGDVLVTIFPWWDGEVTRREVAEQFAQAGRLAFRKWIWIYHAPPDKSSTSWTGKRFIGDTELNQWIAQYRPDLVVAGHIHQSPYQSGGSWIDQIGKTWIINTGAYLGETPPHIVLDLDAMLAEWCSLAGEESRLLA
ncbi:MAG TPA: metallophosphoesterase [Gammaproteobacteria bacterium]|nr:metallophosphoesterase [Gammaproteobacteria bacterium]